MVDIFDLKAIEDLNEYLNDSTENYFDENSFNDPRKRIIPDGFHRDASLSTLPEKSKPLSDKSLNPEQNTILNLEITPFIEQILYEAALEKGTILEPLVEEEIDDVYESTELDIDHEKGLNQAISLLDEYFSLSEKIEKACLRFGWSELSAAKDMAWSLFQEEMEYNWLAVDILDSKADRRLTELAFQNQEPDEDGWQKFLDKRTKLLQHVMKIQYKRYNTTRSLYEQAMKLTEQCKNFWKTSKGKAINQLREQRRQLFKELTSKREDGTCHWNYVRNYWNLRNEEISKSYLSTNDGAGVDDPNEILSLRDTATALSETHLLEQMHQERGDIYWEKILTKWLDRSLDRARRAG